MIWVTADTHFSHRKLLSYKTRPFPTVEAMDDTLIRNWNSLISPSDIVIHLGDVFICPAHREREVMDQLNGVKILVKGNHDTRTYLRYKELGFVEVYSYPIIEGGVILSHFPEFSPAMRSVDYPDWLPPRKVVSASYGIRRKAFKGAKGNVLNICGHVHGFTKRLNLSHFCASVENTDYFPVKFYSVKEILLNRICRG